MKSTNNILFNKPNYRTTIILLIILYIALPVLAETDNKSKVDNARNIVESFCRSEFEGDEFDQRIKLIKFSPAREKKEKIRTGPALPWVVFWDWDEFYIVSSYKVVDVVLSGKRGVATVEYKRIAKSKGKGEIIPSQKGQDIVKLNLVYNGKQWWIFDPPLPRISLKAIVDFYEHYLLRFDAEFFEKASPEEKQGVAQEQKTLKMLKSLQNEIER